MLNLGSRGHHMGARPRLRSPRALRRPQGVRRASNSCVVVEACDRAMTSIRRLSEHHTICAEMWDA